MRSRCEKRVEPAASRHSEDCSEASKERHSESEDGEGGLDHVHESNRDLALPLGLFRAWLGVAGRSKLNGGSKESIQILHHIPLFMKGLLTVRSSVEYHLVPCRAEGVPLEEPCEDRVPVREEARAGRGLRGGAGLARGHARGRQVYLFGAKGSFFGAWRCHGCQASVILSTLYFRRHEDTL